MSIADQRSAWVRFSQILSGIVHAAAPDVFGTDISPWIQLFMSFQFWSLESRDKLIEHVEVDAGPER